MVHPQFEDEKLARNRKMMDDVAKAAFEANADLHQSAHGTGFTALSNSLHQGDTGYADTNQIRAIQNIRAADKAYREVGIIRNVIDLMTDFASEGLKVYHPVPAQQRFYEAWLKKTQMTKISKTIIMGMLKWGNVGVFRFWGKIRPRTKKQMMAKARVLFSQGKDKEAVKAFFQEDKFKKGRVPIRYSCIPPFKVRIVSSLLFDDRRYFFTLSQTDRQKILNPETNVTTELERYLIREISAEVRDLVQKNQFLLLPEENFYFFQYKRDCSRMWADPLVLPIMPDLRYKQVLRRLDISIAESIIDPITLFKLGKTVEGFPPTKEQFQNLSNLLKTPAVPKNLVWSDLIEIERHSLDHADIFATEKYKEVDNDILSGLGVSQVLVNGATGGGRAGNAFLSVKTLLERLEDVRHEFLMFLDAELATVSKAMGFKQAPKVRWEQMSLRDEVAEKRVLVELLDRKVISAETALDILGLDKTIEMERKRREQKATEKLGIPHHVGPFEEAVRVQKDEDPARLTIDVQKEGQEMQAEQADKALQSQEKMGKEQMKQQQDFKKQDVKMQKEVKMAQIKKNKTAPQKGPGRPADKGDRDSRKQKVKRDTKPVGMGSVDADLITQSLYNREVIEDYLKPRILKSFEKENLRQLTKEEKKTYERLIQSVWGFSSPYGSITEEFVAGMSDQVAHGQKADIDADGKTVHHIYDELVMNYRNENLKQPDMRTGRELFAKAQIYWGTTE